MVSPNLELQPILQLEDDLSAPQVGDVGAQADPLAIEDLLQLFQEDLTDQPVGSNGQVAAEIVAPRDMSLDLETSLSTYCSRLMGLRLLADLLCQSLLDRKIMDFIIVHGSFSEFFFGHTFLSLSLL